MADLIVLGGALLLKSCKKGGNTVKVPFQPEEWMLARTN